MTRLKSVYNAHKRCIHNKKRKEMLEIKTGGYFNFINVIFTPLV